MTTQSTTMEDLQQEVERLRSENESLKEKLSQCSCITHHGKMSNSLRDKLKRSGRFQSSRSEEASASKENVSLNRVTTGESSVDWQIKVGDQKKAITEKQERLRKLKMVKMYREKNDLTQLVALTKKWKHLSQRALKDMVELAPEPKPTLRYLVDHLQLDHQQIGFNPENQTFDTS